MKKGLSITQWIVAIATLGVLTGLIIWCLSLIPAVQGLGSKVKLPMFHGASTWADLMILTLMGVIAIVAIIKTHNKSAYAWEVGFRTIGFLMWIANSVMGYIAARSTWDFTGSSKSPFTFILGDPRLKAQLYLVIGAVVLIILVTFVLEKQRYKSIADLAYVVFMWVMMADLFLDPVKRSLHPDSPVLNSEELIIKLPFFGIVAGLFLAEIVIAAIISRYVNKGEVYDLEVGNGNGGGTGAGSSAGNGVGSGAGNGNVNGTSSVNTSDASV